MRACAEFFGDDSFLVISGDALTDIDLTALAARHRESGGVATLAVKQVPDTREYGVVLHDREGRITGFQEKPRPDEALSDLGNCGIYVFTPEIFDYFPERPFADWAQDVFPALLAADVPFYIHEVREYWNDVGSLSELRQGTFDALRGELRLQVQGEEVSPGVIVAGGQELPADAEVEGPAWIGRDVQIGAGVRLTARSYWATALRSAIARSCARAIVFPGTASPGESILIGAISGTRASCRACVRARSKAEGPPERAFQHENMSYAKANSAPTTIVIIARHALRRPLLHGSAPA